MYKWPWLKESVCAIYYADGDIAVTVWFYVPSWSVLWARQL